MPTRKQLITKIWIYKKRRTHLTKRITQWNAQLKEMDAKDERVAPLLKSVRSYFNVDISTGRKKSNHALARNCYFKYGMEELNIKGAFLAAKINAYRSTPSNNRMRFTRSFKTNKVNKETYHKFKTYMEQAG